MRANMKSLLSLHVAAVLLVLLPSPSIAKPLTELERQMFEAVRSGNIAQVKTILKGGADANHKFSLDWTPLMWAAYWGRLEMAELLLDSGADVNAQDQYGATALLHAAWKPDSLPMIRLLVERGADVNARNGYDVTALKMAVDHGNAEMVKYLLDKGANVNTKLTDRSTPLMWAAIPGRLEVARILLERGADVHAKAANGSTALTWAALTGNADIVKLLKAHGAEMTLPITVILGDTRKAERLLGEGADVNAVDQYGRVPLIDAALNNDVEMVRLLLDHHADVDAVSQAPKPMGDRRRHAGLQPGQTALVCAIERGHTQVAALLLKNGADIHVRNLSGWTLLTLARARGYKDVIKLLKAYGAKE